MKVVDIADEIFRELGEPEDTSIPPIAFWLRTNLGKLNSAIHKEYFVAVGSEPVSPLVRSTGLDDTTNQTTDYGEVICLNPNDTTNSTFEEIGEDEKAVFKLIYIVHYYDLQIRKQVLNFNTQRAIEMSSDGHSVRLVSPTEVGKVLAQFRKTAADDLKDWIAWYNINKAVARQVAGDDTIEGNDVVRPIYRRAYYT